MKRYIYTLCLVMASLVLYTSCLGSNDDPEVTFYDDTAITTFKLTTVNRYIHTTTSAGKDSVYKSTCSKMPVFHIDHYQGKIYNTDSLPEDCDLTHVLASISSMNNGTVVIKSLTSDTLNYYSSTDSIDFSKPREIRVYAFNSDVFRTYEVTVNKHQVKTGVLTWEKMEAEDFPTDTEKAKWEQTVKKAGLRQFIGAGAAEAYAFANDGRLMVSKDQGATWTADSLDEASSLLPSKFAFVSWPLATNDSTDYQLLIGTNDQNSTACVVWRKLAEYASGSEPSKWVYIPMESYNAYYLPKMENLNLLRYKGHILAIGDNGKIYESRDKGITWKTNKAFTLPSELTAYHLSAATDDNGYLWIKSLDDNSVWRGFLIE